MENDHSAHDSKTRPVEHCPDCDREIRRPVWRGYGQGMSTAVIPRKDIYIEEG